MDFFKSKTGITLISIVVTIIIMAILAGISISLIQESFDDRVSEVSAIVTEADLKEKVEMAYIDVEASYISKKDNISISKTEYYEEKIKEKLENIANIKDVTVYSNVDGSINISLSSEDEVFNLKILKNKDVKICKKIEGSVKVGDYFEYPVSYFNAVRVNPVEYTFRNGWRVIDDGVMAGTSGCVKIVSTDMPALWKYKEAAVSNLLNCIDNNCIDDSSKVSLENGKINGIVYADTFFISKLAFKISTLSLSDLNRACNSCYGTSREEDDTSDFEDSLGLFKFKKDYWLATRVKGSETGLYCMDSKQGICSSNDLEIDKNGIRLVIYLKQGLDVELDNNVWKVVE